MEDLPRDCLKCITEQALDISCLVLYRTTKAFHELVPIVLRARWLAYLRSHVTSLGMRRIPVEAEMRLVETLKPFNFLLISAIAELSLVFRLRISHELWSTCLTIGVALELGKAVMLRTWQSGKQVFPAHLSSFDVESAVALLDFLTHWGIHGPWDDMDWGKFAFFIETGHVPLLELYCGTHHNWWGDIDTLLLAIRSRSVPMLYHAWARVNAAFLTTAPMHRILEAALWAGPLMIDALDLLYPPERWWGALNVLVDDLIVGHPTALGRHGIEWRTLCKRTHATPTQQVQQLTRYAVRLLGHERHESTWRLVHTTLAYIQEEHECITREVANVLLGGTFKRPAERTLLKGWLRSIGHDV